MQIWISIIDKENWINVETKSCKKNVRFSGEADEGKQPTKS